MKWKWKIYKYNNNNKIIEINWRKKLETIKRKWCTWSIWWNRYYNDSKDDDSIGDNGIVVYIYIYMCVCVPFTDIHKNSASL